MNKVQELRKIAREIEKCKICKIGKSGKPVPGEGNPNAKIVFVGEAPGRTESLTGRPFVGRSGRYLRSLIQKIGLKKEDIFITSPVKYLPDRGTPSIVDILHGSNHLQKQLNIIDSKVVVLLGSVAAFGVLQRKIAVLKLHGTIIDPSADSTGSLQAGSGQVHRKYFVTLHPSAAIRFPKLRKLIEKDFQKLKSLLSSNQ